MSQRRALNPPRRSGFTLIEMSVVLAIIGLLVGGVIVGQSLIRQTELKTVQNDLTKYKTAYMQFKQQYGGPPGDIIDATDYWGLDTSTACNWSGTVSSDRVAKTATCNGNGDGIITLNTQEYWRGWQQLSDAGLIEGAFTGVAGPISTWNSVPGQNNPGSKIANGNFDLANLQNSLGGASTAEFDHYAGTAIFFNGGHQYFNYYNNPLLTPAEQYGLDVKMDDGLPGTGLMLAYKPAALPNCATASDQTATYNLTYQGKSCDLEYILEQI